MRQASIDTTELEVRMIDLGSEGAVNVAEQSSEKLTASTQQTHRLKAFGLVCAKIIFFDMCFKGFKFNMGDKAEDLIWRVDDEER